VTPPASSAEYPARVTVRNARVVCLRTVPIMRPISVAPTDAPIEMKMMA
jgi:hypothetical protein